MEPFIYMFILLNLVLIIYYINVGIKRIYLYKILQSKKEVASMQQNELVVKLDGVRTGIFKERFIL